MSVTLDTPPPKIAFSKNPLWVRLLSNDFLADIPAASVNRLEFTGPVVADAIFALSWTGGAASMVAKAAPDDSGLQFPTGAGDIAYVQTLAPWFAGNFFIDRDFEVSVDIAGANPALKFTARTKSPDFNFTVAAGISNVVPGKTDATKANFRHHLELWLADPAGLSYEQIFNNNIPLDVPSAGLTSSDIHEALHAWLQSDRPELASAYSRCINSIRPYYLKYAQFFGDDPAMQRMFKAQGFFITKGGLGMQQATNHDLIGELCINPGDESTWRCLRQGSNNKLVLKDQPEFLTWINLNAGQRSIELEVIVINDGGSQLTFTAAGPFDAEPYAKYQFQTGFTQLGIAGKQALGVTPIYYSVRVKGANGYLSAAYTYVIDYNFNEFARYFIYENSLGAYQTICTVGRGQMETERSKDSAWYALDRGRAAIVGDMADVNITYQDKGAVNVGYRRSNERTVALLRDLLASDRVFKWDEGFLIPILVTNTNHKDAPDGANVYAPVIEYAPKYNEEVYTEKLGLPDDTVADLLANAGSPVQQVPGGAITNGTIVVDFGDPLLSVVNGQQVYTAPLHLAGRSGYRVYSTMAGQVLRSQDISYNIAAGSFTILAPQPLLDPGEQLVIWPYIINPLLQP